MPNGLRASDKRAIERLVAFYEHDDQQSRLTSLRESLRVQLAAYPPLRPLIHSIKIRVKDPGHLRDKLERKARALAKERKLFKITERNLFREINDLVGVRLIHIHTTQFGNIRDALRVFFKENQYELIENFEARTWDDENREYFNSIGASHKPSKTMYTSVHCVIATNIERGMTAEMQIRTLSDELWGEVDHQINYPHPTDVVTCREQLKVLARVTSSATRLVDSIYSAHGAAEASSSARSRRSHRVAPRVSPQRTRRR